MSIKVYHNPRCSKSRQALNYLEERNIQYEVISYMKEPLSKAELTDVLVKLDIPAESLLRKKEQIFKDKFVGKNLSNQEWINAMIEFPKLMERPILVNKSKAVIARPTELIDSIL